MPNSHELSSIYLGREGFQGFPYETWELHKNPKMQEGGYLEGYSGYW